MTAVLPAWMAASALVALLIIAAAAVWLGYRYQPPQKVAIYMVTEQAPSDEDEWRRLIEETSNVTPLHRSPLTRQSQSRRNHPSHRRIIPPRTEDEQ